MKNVLPIIVFTSLAAAQNTIADLPSCALTCLISTIDGLGCDVTDFACSCQKADQLTPVVTPCVQTACIDVAEQAKTVTVLSGICAAAGFPIEVPVPPASNTAIQPTSTAEYVGTEAPLDTQPSAIDGSEYPTYPTATETTSEHPGLSLILPITTTMLTQIVPTHVTDDVPNLPYSYSDLVPLPSFVNTVIISRPSPKPTSAPGVLPPYPTGTPAPSVPAPSGTSTPSTASPQLPEFTGAAAAIQAPMVAAGVLGLAALVL